MKKIKTVTTEFSPRPHQVEIYKKLKRFNVLVCHRRFGKTVLAINELIDRGLQNKLLNPRYAYIAPNYGQAKRVAWDYLKYYTKNIPGVSINEAELRVDIKRAKQDCIRFTLLGAENPDSIRGIYLDGVVMDEYAEMSPSIFTEVVRPALSDRKGWALFIGTPKGHNHFHELYMKAEMADDWYTKVFKASETGIVDKEELEAAKMVMSEDEYNQEYECSWTSSVSGSYYSKNIVEIQNKGQITSVPYQKDALVDTYWDLGIGDSLAIWFCQRVGREYQFIDYYEDSGKGLEEVMAILDKKGYLYGDAVLPHDAAHRELGTGRPRVKTLSDLGLKRITVLPRQGVDVGIQAVRSILGQCWFDAVKCKRGIDALKGYQRKWDKDNKVFSSTPMHNWACLSGETKIRTLSGWKPIEDLVGKDFYVWSYSLKEKRLVPAKVERCWMTKETDDLVRVKLDDGEEIVCTSDHRFLTRDCRWVEAGKLEEGESLMPFYEANKSTKYTRVHLNDGSIAQEHHFVFNRFNGHLKSGHVVHHIDEDKNNNNPENLQQMTVEEHISLHASQPERLAKLRANSNRTPSKKSAEHLVWMNKKRSGDNHHTRQEGYYTEDMKQSISKECKRWMKSTETLKSCPVCSIEYLGNYKRIYCCDLCKATSIRRKKGQPESPYRKTGHSENCRIVKNNHKVISVEKVNEKRRVYDISVPETNNFVANGVVVHNSHGSDAFRYFAMGVKSTKIDYNLPRQAESFYNCLEGF